MTLIVAAFNKSAVCVSTDTQLTNLADPSQTAQAVKSNYFFCKNGKFLAAYTGNDVYLEAGVHVADWITNLLSDNDIRNKKAATIISSLVDGLNEKYYYKRSDIAPLIILIAGWVFTDEVAKPKTYRITNCETESSEPKLASKTFEVFESSDKRDVIVRGSVQRGIDSSFESKVKYIKKLLKTATLQDFRDTVGKGLFELNTIAHNNPQWGQYIGEQTMFSTIHKKGDGVDYWRYPESKDYLLPNFNNGTMSVRGLQVHNDPIKGGTITLDIKK